MVYNIRMKQIVIKSIEDFKVNYEDKCVNELASLAYFHLFFFDILISNLRGTNIKIKKQTIVSNHIDKSPIAKFKINSKVEPCELGDLFFVKKCKNQNKAIFIQAKQSHKSFIGKSTKKETFLYDHWPEFEVTKPACMARSFPHIPDEKKLSRFLTFFENEYFIRLGTSSNCVTTFEDFFNNFLSCNSDTGKVFLTKSESRLKKIASLCDSCDNIELENDTNWDVLVTSLMVYFEERTFNNKNVGQGQQKQISTNLSFLGFIEPDLNEYLNFDFEENKLNIDNQLHFSTLIIIE
jgi:hypothetical protein